MSISSVFKTGVLVDLYIKMWTGERRLTAEDLGMDPNKISDAFKLGRKTLIPSELTNSIKRMDGQARKLLTDMSYPFPFGGARFLPKKVFVEFDEKFSKLKEEFRTLSNEIITNIDKYKLEMRSTFLAASKIAYKRVCIELDQTLKTASERINLLGGLTLNEATKGKTLPELLERLQIVGGIPVEIASTPHAMHCYTALITLREQCPKDIPVEVEVRLDETQYINNFLERIDKCYPAPEKLAQKYLMDYSIYQMELPDICEATLEDVEEENAKVQLLQEAYQKKMRKAMEQYAETIVRDNRERVEKVINTLIENINSGKMFTESTHTMITNMIQDFKKIDIVSDKGLTSRLDTFKTTYLDPNTAKAIRENPSLQKTMLTELQFILKIVQDTSEIQALSEAYRSQLQL